MVIKQTLQQWALDLGFLHGRMSFICGPRQIGKTTLAQNHLERINQTENYHNWDGIKLRQQFALNPLFFIENIARPLSSAQKISVEKRPWVVFDEIHKYPQWKNILKGYFDEFKNKINFVITGSARKGGIPFEPEQPQNYSWLRTCLGSKLAGGLENGLPCV